MVSLAGAAAAQTTISQPLSTIGDTRSGHGQSFLATHTGVLTKIRVRSLGSDPTTLHIWEPNDPSYPYIDNEPVYVQNVTMVNVGSVNSGFHEITLTTPYDIQAGHSYAFAFGNATLARTQGGPRAYPDGFLLRNFEVGNYINSLAFEVVQEDAPEPVPTLSEWAMILFGTILAGGAALCIERRRQYV